MVLLSQKHLTPSSLLTYQGLNQNLHSSKLPDNPNFLPAIFKNKKSNKRRRINRLRVKETRQLCKRITDTSCFITTTFMLIIDYRWNLFILCAPNLNQRPVVNDTRKYYYCVICGILSLSRSNLIMLFGNFKMLVIAVLRTKCSQYERQDLTISHTQRMYVHK